MPLDGLLRRHAAYRRDDVAIVFGGHRLTTAELNARVNRLANALLELGLAKGDKVALVLDNSLELLELYHAAAKTGLVVVPLSPLLRSDGLVTLVNDADSLALVTTGRLAPEVDAVRTRLGVPGDRFILVDDGAMPGFIFYRELNIIYSSGTTGHPKWIVHTHRIREAYCTGFAASFRFSPDSVVLHAGSLVFNGAFLSLMPAVYFGCTYVLMARFDARETIRGDQGRAGDAHGGRAPRSCSPCSRTPASARIGLPQLERVCSVGAPLPARAQGGAGPAPAAALATSSTG